MKQITNTDLAKLAASGTSVTEIAEKLGVTPSAVTQALSSPDVQYLVQLEQSKSQAQVFDDRYDTLEGKVLGIMERRLPLEGQSMKMRELTTVLQTLNNMKRRGGPGVNGHEGNAKVVQLVMPVQINNKIVVNAQSEIVEIDGRTMVTVDPKQIQQLAEAHDATQPKQLADLL